MTTPDIAGQCETLRDGCIYMRDSNTNCVVDSEKTDELLTEAADTIERLVAENKRLREVVARAYIAGAMSVHEYWTENPGEAPRGDPEFDEAAHDYAYASEALNEAAPQILALLKGRAPAPEGEAVAWRYRWVENKRTGKWFYQGTPPTHLGNEGEVQPLYASPVVPAPEGEAWDHAFRPKATVECPWSLASSYPTDYAKFVLSDSRYEVVALYTSPVVPVGVSRGEIAAIIMKTAHLDLTAGFPPFGQIVNPREIADAILAALGTKGADHD